MATRACIAQIKDNGWEGVYSHWDGTPSWLGRKIWYTIQSQFLSNKGNPEIRTDCTAAIRAFCDMYITGHRSGWRVFGQSCYCHDPDFVPRNGLRDGTITSDAPDPLFIEWVYLLDPMKALMTIYSHKVESKSGPDEKVRRLPDGKSDYGDCFAWHQEVVKIPLMGPEPDWERIETHNR